jgi:ribosomal protein L37AE/L43A
MKHHIKIRHTGRYETDCGKMIRNKEEVTSSRMDTTCPECEKVIMEKTFENAKKL